MFRKLGYLVLMQKNTATPESDIDFLIEFKQGKKNLFNLVYLGDYLEKLFDKKVDIVTPQGLSKYIGKYILAETEYAAL